MKTTTDVCLEDGSFQGAYMILLQAERLFLSVDNLKKLDSGTENLFVSELLALGKATDNGFLFSSCSDYSHCQLFSVILILYPEMIFCGQAIKGGFYKTSSDDLKGNSGIKN